MLTKEEARALVAAELGRLQANAFLRTPDSLVIMDERTIERSWGWIFFYNSRRYLETRNPLDGLGGNAPFIVNRHTGEVRATGTAYSVEYYIAEYEKSRG